MIDCGRELPTVDTSWAGSNDTPAGRRAQKRAGGEIITHLQLAESVWNRAAQRADTCIVYNFGRAEDPVVRERLRTLAGSILRQVAPEEIVATPPDWTLREAWPYGDLYVLEHLWTQIGMPERLPALTRDNTRRTLPVERACFAMMANRCLAPASKLYCYEQWLCEDVRIAGAGGLELRHLYRAMDFFAPQGAAGEVAVLPDRGPVLVRRRAHLLLHDHAPL